MTQIYPRRTYSRSSLAVASLFVRLTRVPGSRQHCESAEGLRDCDAVAGLNHQVRVKVATLIISGLSVDFGEQLRHSVSRNRASL